MKFKRKNTQYVLTMMTVLTFLISVVSCTVSYSFTGTSISPDVKTFTINEFTARNPDVNSTYPEEVMEALRQKFIKQTKLSATQEDADLEFEGSITGWDIKAMSIKDESQEATNRFTVTMQIKFTDNKNHDNDFETSFSAFYDFSTDTNFADIESTMLEAITEEIVDNIFNKSVANW